MTMRITTCFGGSTFNPEDIEIDTVEEIAKVLKEIREKDHEVLVTVGGGTTAKKYIELGKKLGASHKELDQIGIKVTRINARLLISALGDLAGEEPPHNFEKALRIMLKEKIPVVGGTTPGHTTDAVAAELARNSDSDLLIFFTDVDGVYTSDPKKEEGAEKIDIMSTSEIAKLMSKMEFEPGMTAIIDPLAAEILEQGKIRTLVLGKGEISRLLEIIEGSEHHGTEITPADQK